MIMPWPALANCGGSAALPAGNPAIAAFTEFFSDFGLADGLLVVVETDRPSPDILIEAAQTGNRITVKLGAAESDWSFFLRLTAPDGAPPPR